MDEILSHEWVGYAFWRQRTRSEVSRSAFFIPKGANAPGVDSPFFSTIVLFKNQLFPWVFDGFLKRRKDSVEQCQDQERMEIVNALTNHFQAEAALLRCCAAVCLIASRSWILSFFF